MKRLEKWKAYIPPEVRHTFSPRCSLLYGKLSHLSAPQGEETDSVVRMRS